MSRFAEKAVAVTGGASGIGEAAVRRFVEEGARVAFADRDADRGRRVAAALAAQGAVAHFVEADMGKEAQATGSSSPRPPASAASTCWSTTRGSASTRR